MYRIVLVEDETTVREGIVRRINWQEHGFVLAGAYENGVQAVQALEQEPVDVVITDINMPAMDGLELAKRINEYAPDTIVIILTGFEDFSYAQAAIKYRVYEYVLKPITARQLRELLDKLREELDVRRVRLKDMEALKGGVEQAIPILREYRFQRLIKGEIAEEEICEIATEFPLEMQRESVCVALLAEREDAESPQSGDILLNTARSVVQGTGVEAFSDGNGRTVLLLFGPAYREKARVIAQTLNQEYNLSVSCALGEPAGQLGEMKQSYAQASLIWEHLFHLEPGCVISAKEVPHANRQAAAAVDYLREHYNDPHLSLQDVTTYLSVSTSHFSHIFKAYTGLTFIDFLTRLRMDKAQKLLETTDFKNYEIANVVGYEDPGYFGNLYKKYSGMKPSEYRKHFRKGKNQ